MKKITFAIFALIISAVTLTSCDNEAIDSTLDLSNPGTENPENPGGGTSTGDYWPMAINNRWTFSSNGVLQQPMKISATQQSNGFTYYKYENFFGSTTGGSAAEVVAMTRKSNGNYYVNQIANIPAQEGSPAITISPLEVLLLKDNIAVNETWTQNLTQTTTVTGFPQIVTTINVQGTILEKNTTLTVGEEEFTNVIKVKLVQITQGVTITTYYWFAKDVGPIKYQTNTSSGFDQTNELASYQIN